ncbi:hypothetical protein AXF42_Ash000932 [Apostasia shenzhenica]|uniref:Uncharacterized protein n=1 Tax=Apostasia shenzhenica TaxID=1088818 RepID=A0A2I0ATH2_9ASPA|nr:hypothetical protein AXF42_Ash000932 [Apostasia shenzhenica]
MEFHTLARRDLQFLCKKNRIPANMTNNAMANALQALETVEGVEEIQNALEIQSPKKAEASSSETSCVGLRSSARRLSLQNEPKIQQLASPLPRSCRVIAKSPAIMEDCAKEEDDDRSQKETSMDLPKTPAAARTLRKTAKGSEAPSTRRRGTVTRRRSVISSEAKEGKVASVLTARTLAIMEDNLKEVEDEDKRNQKEAPMDLPKTPAAARTLRKTVKASDAPSTRRREDKVPTSTVIRRRSVISDEANEGKSVGVMTRRSTRLSLRKQIEEQENPEGNKDKKNKEEEERQGSSPSFDRKNSSVEVLKLPEEEGHANDSKGEEKEYVEQEIVDFRRLEDSPIRGLVSSCENQSPEKKIAENGPQSDSAMKESIILDEAFRESVVFADSVLSGDVSGRSDEEEETKISRLFNRLILDEVEKVNEEDGNCSVPVADGISKDPEETVTSPPVAIDAGVPQGAIFAYSVSRAYVFYEDPVMEKDQCCTNIIVDEIPKEPEEFLTAPSLAMVAGEYLVKEKHCCTDPTSAIQGELEHINSLPQVIDAGAPEDAIFASEVSIAEAEFLDVDPLTEREDCCTVIIGEIPKEPEEFLTAPSPAIVAGVSAELNKEEDSLCDTIAARIPIGLQEFVSMQSLAIDAGIPLHAIVHSEISKAAAEIIQEAPVTEEDNCSVTIVAHIPVENDESGAGPLPAIVVAEESAEELNKEDNRCSDSIDPIEPQDAITDSENSNDETNKDDRWSDVKIPKETKEFVTAPPSAVLVFAEESAGAPLEPEVPQDVSFPSKIPKASEESVCETQVRKKVDEYLNSIAAVNPKEDDDQDPDSEIKDSVVKEAGEVAITNETTQEVKGETAAGITSMSSYDAAVKMEEENMNPKPVKENLLKDVNLEDLSMRKLKATYKKKLTDHNKLLGRKISSIPKLEEQDCLSWSSKFKQKTNDSSNKFMGKISSKPKLEEQDCLSSSCKFKLKMNESERKRAALKNDHKKVNFSDAEKFNVFTFWV